MFRTFKTLEQKLRKLRKKGTPLSRSLSGVTQSSDPDLFNLLLMTAARNIASDKDYRVVPMLPSHTTEIDYKKIRIGMYGNMANNNYALTKALQELGYDAETVIENNFTDSFLMNKPFWEDVEVECEGYEQGLTFELLWKKPDYVNLFDYDPEFGQKYKGRLSAIPEVQALYQQEFGITLTSDRAFLLAQYMAHWPYLLSMKKYDLMQFCGSPISLAPFCPKPYIILPAGGELHISAFTEDVSGLLMRAGFRNAATILNGDCGYPRYYKRMGIDTFHTFRWLIQMSLYPEAADPAVKHQWNQQIGGDKFILMACRQNWEDKGNDVFLRSFAKIYKDFPDWRVILLRWGQHIEESDQLIKELGLENHVHWMPLLSRPMLRKYQATADLVIDHCSEFGVGATPIESLAAGTPVIMRKGSHYQDLMWECPNPPLLTFGEEPELPGLLAELMGNEAQVEKLGKNGRDWVKTHLSAQVGIEYHLQAYKRALLYG